MQSSVAGIFFMVLVVCVGIIPNFTPEIDLPSWWFGSVEDDFETGTMLFVGDIMLGRHVEQIMRANGNDYPFLGTRDLIRSVDVAVGNFEAATPKKHLPTKDFVMKLSVDQQLFSVLKENGFDTLSLANNHSFDFGNEGYLETITACREQSLGCFGHPYEVRSVSVGKVEVGDSTVGMLFLHALTLDMNETLFERAMKDLYTDTDFQVAFVHWGTEYEKLHSPEQEALAVILIDGGIDAVIGHHPHVVQDIAQYKGKPIFYSLGNFIFDQYFDPSVEEGIALKLTIGKDTVDYTIIPITSRMSKSQPQLMSVDEKMEFLEGLTLDPLLGQIDSTESIFVVKR